MHNNERRANDSAQKTMTSSQKTNERADIMSDERAATPETTKTEPEPRSDSPTLLSDITPTYFRQSDSVRQSDSPTVRQLSDSRPTLFPSGKVHQQCQTVSNCQTDRPTVRQSDTNIIIMLSSDSPTAM